MHQGMHNACCLLHASSACTIHAYSADLWLEDLAALCAQTEAACRAGHCSFTVPPSSMLSIWYLFHGTNFAIRYADPLSMVLAVLSYSKLHWEVHKRLLASDAVAAQRTETVAVAAARCCLRAAQAVDSWQGELAETVVQEQTRVFAVDALIHNLETLSISPPSPAMLLAATAASASLASAPWQPSSTRCSLWPRLSRQ